MIVLGRTRGGMEDSGRGGGAGASLCASQVNPMHVHSGGPPRGLRAKKDKRHSRQSGTLSPLE